MSKVLDYCDDDPTTTVLIETTDLYEFQMNIYPRYRPSFPMIDYGLLSDWVVIIKSD